MLLNNYQNIKESHLDHLTTMFNVAYNLLTLNKVKIIKSPLTFQMTISIFWCLKIHLDLPKYN